MNVVIRADANSKIGMGHIMRCLSIADAFTSAGHHVSFVLADYTVENLIRNRGYKALILKTDYTRMEGENWISTTSDIIIVDSYYVTAQYLVSLRDKMNMGGKLVYIDDVCSFPYFVDILVNYNVYAVPEIYNKLYDCSEKPEFILGPTYAPLRSMFRGIEKHSQPEMVQNILISTGGSDELHLTLSVMRYLVEQGDNEKTYHIILGAMNTDKEQIRRMAGGNIVLYENVFDMKSLIANCDLAISAAGSTLYEICACGVPLITFSTADNQIPGAKAFERLGLGINVGDLRDQESINPELIMSGSLEPSAVERIMTATKELTGDYEERVLMGRRMQDMIDGFGADRMVDIILELTNDKYP